MHPILFHIGNFPLGTYGLMLVLGFFSGMYLARYLGRRDQIPGESISDLSVTVLMGGIIGAHLLMIIVGLLTPAGQDGAMTFADIFTLSTLRAGGAIHGGVIGGTLAYFWRIRKLKLSWRPTMDAMVPGLALGQAIGRIGCFFAGCCYGDMCGLPWAVTFRDPETRILSGTPLDVPLHPVQLYSTLFSLTIMGLLLLLGRKRKFQGQIVAAYFILEGISRSIQETWRGDLDRGVWLGISWLSTGRLTALGFVLFGIGLWIWCMKTKMKAKA
jgi:phosphatidylglycerol---prolipoprotein diacylglyceryl transferase